MANKKTGRGRTKKIRPGREDPGSNRFFLRRTFCVMAVCGIILFIPLFINLGILMIGRHDELESAAIANQTRTTNITASRGTIYDRNMNVLAISTTVENVFLDPQDLAADGVDLVQLSEDLAEILDLDPEYILEAAMDTSTKYKVIARKVSIDVTDQIRSYISARNQQIAEANKGLPESARTPALRGIYMEADSLRAYPQTSLAAQVLGFTNAENKGAEGLEAYYESTLLGNAGAVVNTTGNGATEMLYSYEKYYEASDGQSLVLTLDSTVQYYLEKNMEAAIEKYDVLNGAFGIVMDVNTGEILGMATMGTYDPNHYMEIYDEETREELDELYDAAMEEKEGSPEREALMAEYNEAMVNARLGQWRNRCVSDGYEPGSTFKCITLAAALEEGAVTLDNTYFCGGATMIRGRDDELHCWQHQGHATQTTAQALQNSCNIAFADIGIALGGDALYNYVEAFGLMERTGLDLPGEGYGYFFDRDVLTDPDSFASLTSASFGQTFKVTPIQLVRALSAVVNGGYVLEPYIVSQILDDEGNVVHRNETTVLRQAISEDTSALMCELMESVVTEGTASNAQVAGYAIGGKTGTSEKIDVFDEYGRRVDDKIVSFVGVAPIDDPQYIVLVALDTPAVGTGYYISGGVMAAPTVRDVLTDILPYLGVGIDYTDENISSINMTMPAVTGMTEAEAAEELQANNLTYIIVGEGNKVTDQIPAPGGQVPGGSEVILYMGEEKPTDMIIVPDFRGMTVAQVNQAIIGTGLYLQSVGSSNTGGFVTVTSQDIEPGTEVERGTLVTVEFTDSSAQD